MRQTSEEFAKAMIGDVAVETPQSNLTEMLAETEKRITEKLTESQQALFNKLDAINTAVDQVDESSVDESSQDESNQETNEE